MAAESGSAASPYFKRLQRYLATDVPSATGWYDAFCPLHDDTTRSAGFNFKTGKWSCRVKCGAGSLRDLVARLDARDAFDAEVRSRDNPPDESEPETNVVGLAERRANRRQSRPCAER